MAKTTKFEEGFQFGATHYGEPVDSVAELVSLLAEANTDTIKTDDLELVDAGVFIGTIARKFTKGGEFGFDNGLCIEVSL